MTQTTDSNFLSPARFVFGVALLLAAGPSFAQIFPGAEWRVEPPEAQRVE